MKRTVPQKRSSGFESGTLLSQESGSVRKKWQGQITVGLVYPNRYFVGMSNLGFQTLYSIINRHDHFLCERFFMESEEPSRYQSFESGKLPGDFNILAFSVSFENDYLNVIRFIKKSGLNLQSDRRHELDPLLMAGGAALTINPEALADFLDLVVLGEADHLIGPILERIEQASSSRWHKSAVLEAVTPLPAVYIPSAYTFHYQTQGLIKEMTVKAGYPERIPPARTESLDQYPVHSTLVTPHTEFGQHFLIELARGCSRRCSFCYGGWGYQPLRIRSRDCIVQQIEQGTNVFSRLERKPVFGLIAPSMTDCPFLEDLLDVILDRQCQFSLSSVPLEFLSESNIARLARSSVKSLTLAPEAGTVKLRKLIGKKWDQELFYNQLEQLWAARIFKLRFYFMIGLPGEQLDDLKAIIQFIRHIRHLADSHISAGRAILLHISLNAFVPKPHTPFQWQAMNTHQELVDKIKKIKRGLHKEHQVVLTHDIPKWARIQGLIARADRRVGPFIAALDGNQGNIAQALRQVNLNPDFYLNRRLDPGERLAWAHLTALPQKGIVSPRPQNCSAVGPVLEHNEKSG
ncbi:radical SAM protein [bacterium]|nr:radical SAM protein [bacterium]